MANKFYLTTPIYYVNARPHIGHAYSTIAADVIARRHRLLGDDVFFLTGTDEHGQKVQRSAAAAGIPPQQFADQVSASFSNLWQRMGITNNDFIRTTDPRHKRGVQKLWQDLEARGAIYLSTYTGQYSVGEEMFIDGPPGTLGPDGKPTETVTEENYFFRLSDYQQPILDLIESNTLHIQPEAIRNEVLSFLRGNVAEAISVAISEGKTRAVALDEVISNPLVEAGIIKLSALGIPYIPCALKDLSISRTTFDWGIKVPNNPKHVVYVWLDALVNYLTAIGYGSEDPLDIEKFEKYWPADLHLVGKEITRFHCVYWPAFLLAAGLPLPKSVVANGWLLFEESKMSKSRGNVVRTETILDAFGPLCPPPPAARAAEKNDAAIPRNPSHKAVIPGEARNLRISSDQPPPSPVLLKGTASAVPQTASPEAAALAAEVTPTTPTKAHQDLFAADILRYYLLREIPFGQDGSFSFDALITRYNADLANGYGNLVSRTLKMIADYFGEFPNYEFPQESEGWNRHQWLEYFYKISPIKIFWSESSDAKGETNGPQIMDIFNSASALHSFLEIEAVIVHAGSVARIQALISLTDRYLSNKAPWKLAKSTIAEDRKGLEEILYTAAESIRIITALLYPILPYATASVWAQLGLGSIEEAAKNGELKNLQWGGLRPGTKLGPLSPIFPRADKGLAQIMTDLESPTTPTPEQSAPEPRTSNPEPDSSPITIDDFTRIDLRVAQIVLAERIPKADKLLRLEVDLGPGHPRRQILSGIAEWYTPEELIGRRIAIIANLAPRKMRGLESHGMLLAASADAPATKPILATFSDEVPLGSRIK